MADTNKQIRLQSLQVNFTYTRSNPQVVSTKNQAVVSISITNLPASPNNLLIGLNEDPSTKLFLQAGESISFGPYRDADLLNDNLIKLGFDDTAGTDPLNSAVVVLSSEGDKPFC